jgi:hypothetical protein
VLRGAVEYGAAPYSDGSHFPALWSHFHEGIDVKTVYDCFNILEAAFQSRRWKQLSQQERVRLVGRLSHLMEIAEKRDLEE